MTTSLHEMKQFAATLPVADRAELAQFLIHSLDEGSEFDARADWISLAEARMEDVKAGNVVCMPANMVLQTLLRPRPQELMCLRR